MQRVCVSIQLASSLHFNSASWIETQTLGISIQLALVVSIGEPSTTAAQRVSPPALAPHSSCWGSCGDSSSQPWLDSAGHWRPFLLRGLLRPVLLQLLWSVPQGKTINKQHLCFKKVCKNILQNLFLFHIGVICKCCAPMCIGRGSYFLLSLLCQEVFLIRSRGW